MGIIKNNFKPFNCYMDLALEVARKSSNEVPVGAVIVSPKGEVITYCHNLSYTTNDPIAHAEILSIRNATQRLGCRFLNGYSLYVTLEPCMMCAYAISLARISQLYYGTEDTKGGAVTNGMRIYYSTIKLPHTPVVYGGICETECSAILKDFFIKLRKNKQTVI